MQKALRDRVVEGVDELRETELVRLNELHRAWWPKAAGGDVTAAQVVLRALEQRVRLLRLDQVPTGPSGPLSIVLGTG